MIRIVFVMSLSAFAPIAPVGAVVAIVAPAQAMPAQAMPDQTTPAQAMPAQATPVTTPARTVPARMRSKSSGPDFGELAAALIGLGVLGIAVFGTRQPHSVTA